ncbi:MAG: hypothetical protein MZV70_01255 [Desulfobacterales bacterium]|nr:hypothetical protein [Desulfobacterales bacterium]
MNNKLVRRSLSRFYSPRPSWPRRSSSTRRRSRSAMPCSSKTMPRPGAYYYMPNQPRLAFWPDGTPKLTFLKYTKAGKEEAKGGILHFFVKYGLDRAGAGQGPPGAGQAGARGQAQGTHRLQERDVHGHLGRGRRGRRLHPQDHRRGEGPAHHGIGGLGLHRRDRRRRGLPRGGPAPTDLPGQRPLRHDLRGPDPEVPGQRHDLLVEGPDLFRAVPEVEDL